MFICYKRRALMKKIIALLLCMVMVISLCACAVTTTTKKPKKGSTEYVQGEPTEEYEDTYIKGEDIHTTEVIEKRIPVKTGAIMAQDLTGNKLRAANIEAGEDQAFLEAGILKDEKGNISGNMTRVANAIRKVKAGKDIKIVAYGGINCGGEDSYGKVLKEHLSTMGSGNVSLVEYGDDGSSKATGREAIYSNIAAYMIKSEVIDLKPDLVILDFAIGDGINGTKANSAAFENMVRRVLTKTSAGLIIVCGAAATESSWALNSANADPLTSGGKELGYYHKEIAKFYKVPVIDFEGVVWNTIAQLVEKKYYSESPLLSWQSFATDSKTYSFATKINIGNMLSLYCDKVAAKLNDASTKSEPVYGNNSDIYTYRYSNNSFMDTDFVNIVDPLGKNVKGFKCSKSSSQVMELGGRALYTVNDNMIQTYTVNKNIVASYRKTDLQPSVVEFDIPKVKDGNKCYFISTYNGTKYQLYAKDWSVDCYNSNGILIKSASQGRNGGLSMFTQEIPKETVKVRLVFYVENSDTGNMTWFGFASQKGFN